MTTQQIWQLLEIYKQMQSANTMIAYGNAFEELHEFIEEQLQCDRIQFRRYAKSCTHRNGRD